MVTPSDLDIRAAAKRVLGTINQMLCHYFWKTRMKQSLPQDSDSKPEYVAIHNATVESSLVSIRILDDIFGESRKYPDDLHQSDFSGLAPSTSFLTKLDREGINKQIAHITRLKLIPEQHPFPYKTFLSGAIPPAEAFCNYLTSLQGTFNDQDTQLIADTLAALGTVHREYAKT